MDYIDRQEKSLIELLQSKFLDRSKTGLKEWIKQGRVYINNKLCTNPKTVVNLDSQVQIKPKKKFISDIEILYQDAHIIVLNKPNNMLSVASEYDASLSVHDFLKRHLKPKRVFPVHRLDKHTSGLMVFALTDVARKRLKQQFFEKCAKRQYIALVEGLLKPKKGSWVSNLSETSAFRVYESNDGKLAKTEYEVLKHKKSTSLVQFTLQTGRKNQIRVQAASRGNFVVGDKKYGSTIDPYHRLCLHAKNLEITHPITKKLMKFSSDHPWG